MEPLESRLCSTCNNNLSKSCFFSRCNGFLIHFQATRLCLVLFMLLGSRVKMLSRNQIHLLRQNGPAGAFECGLTASNVHKCFASCLCCCTDFTPVNSEFLLLTFKQTSEQAAQSFCRCCFEGRISNVGCTPESSSARLSVRLD